MLELDGRLPVEYQNVFDPLETLTFVAANTEKITLGTSTFFTCKRCNKIVVDSTDFSPVRFLLIVTSVVLMHYIIGKNEEEEINK
jgi:hypothetical protein